MMRVSSNLDRLGKGDDGSNKAFVLLVGDMRVSIV